MSDTLDEILRSLLATKARPNTTQYYLLEDAIYNNPARYVIGDEAWKALQIKRLLTEK